MSHNVYWGGGDEEPMIVTDEAGNEYVIPYDDAVGVAQQIASHMGENLPDVVHHFVQGDHLQVDAGIQHILDDVVHELKAG